MAATGIRSLNRFFMRTTTIAPIVAAKNINELLCVNTAIMEANAASRGLPTRDRQHAIKQKLSASSCLTSCVTKLKVSPTSSAGSTAIAALVRDIFVYVANTASDADAEPYTSAVTTIESAKVLPPDNACTAAV